MLLLLGCAINIKTIPFRIPPIFGFEISDLFQFIIGSRFKDQLSGIDHVWVVPRVVLLDELQSTGWYRPRLGCSEGSLIG